MRKASLLMTTALVGVLCVFALPRHATDQRDISFDISPDSRSVLFNSGGGAVYGGSVYLSGGNAVCILNLSTMKVQGPMRPQSVVLTPAFSPDGQRIISAAAKDGDQVSHLYTYSLAGKAQRQMTHTAGVYDDMASYSADGSQIVFARALRHRPYSMGGWTWDHWDIYVVRADGTGLHRLTSGEYYQVTRPRFAPDGKTVLFAADHDESGALQTDVFTVNSAGGEAPKPLTGDGHSSQPVFTPDGSHIVYISDAAIPFDYELWSMDADGGHATQLTHEHSYLENPVVTRDGRHILALSDKSRASRYDLEEFDINGQHPRRLADSRLFDDPLHWKPE